MGLDSNGMANVLHGMRIRRGSLALAVVALFMCAVRGAAQDEVLWTFDTGG